MSTAVGIASVTYVLLDLLNNGVVDSDVSTTVGGIVKVSALPPDRIDIDTEASALNLFMYQVRPNSGWRNEGLPSFDAGGQRISSPPLALDLHYVLSAYGREEFHAEILLGYGMQLLHESPILTRAMIRQSLPNADLANAGHLPPLLKNLAMSELADQVEQIKISLESMGTEEMSRLWTAFQAKYRMSAAYKVTVVLIESKRPVRPTLPVRMRNIYALPFGQISIDGLKAANSVENQVGIQKFIAGQQVILYGKQLNRDGLKLRLDDKNIAFTLIDQSGISFTIPADKKTGLHGLQIIHEIKMGDPPADHPFGASNLFGFVVSPELKSATYVNVSDNLKLTVAPAIEPEQKLLILLNEIDTDNPNALSIPHSLAAAATEFTIRLNNIRPGKYLVRIQVDGVESALMIDPSGNFIPVTIS